ncbi:hypothetical protein BT93_C1396 [Corymbia citriodora subsp. variegata]|nr:hypothetical protein BT93_C1396 [Corymbia citriodora subsp. variegata]
MARRSLNGDPTVLDDAGELLQASLFLSVLKHTGDCAEDARASSSPEPLCRPNRPPVVRLVNTLIDSIDRCRGPFEKRVMASDLREHQNRLILWKEDVREFVLPLLGEGDDPEEGVAVTVFNTEGEAFRLRFKLWAGKVYVLMGRWNEFAKASRLEESDILRIWAFRRVRTEALCFVIAVRRSKAAGQRRNEKGARTEGRKRVESKPRKVL